MQVPEKQPRNGMEEQQEAVGREARDSVRAGAKRASRAAGDRPGDRTKWSLAQQAGTMGSRAASRHSTPQSQMGSVPLRWSPVQEVG